MKVKDYFLSQEEFDLKEISEGILQTNPIPENLSKYYESEKYISHHQDDKSLKTRIYKFFQKSNFKYKKNLISQFLKNNDTILDYGCGAGDFLNYIKNDYNVFGIEPNHDAAEIASKKIGNDKLKKKIEEFDDNTFDAITLWHVFEHIKDQNYFIKEVSKKLKQGGKLIIAIPNYKSYDATYYKNYWAAYDVPRHIFHISRKGMKSIFEENKWNIKKIDPLLLDSYYISIISEKYKKNALSWIKGPIIGAISNIKASKSGEFSSLVYIIEKL